MNLARYPVTGEPSGVVFEFQSVGPKGKITKAILYSETNTPNVYNLGFGDMDFETGEIRDDVVTDNGDRDKILATVAATALIFSETHQDAWIYVCGLTDAHTRLYQMSISRYLEEIEERFLVYGAKDGEWVPFEKNTLYSEFLVQKKR